MSLIGPRPLLVQYLPLYSEKQKHRHCMVITKYISDLWRCLRLKWIMRSILMLSRDIGFCYCSVILSMCQMCVNFYSDSGEFRVKIEGC